MKNNKQPFEYLGIIFTPHRILTDRVMNCILKSPLYDFDHTPENWNYDEFLKANQTVNGKSNRYDTFLVDGIERLPAKFNLFYMQYNEYRFKRIISETTFYEQSITIPHIDQDKAIKEALEYSKFKWVHPAADSELIIKKEPLRLNKPYHIGVKLEMMMGKTDAIERSWRFNADYTFNEINEYLQTLNTCFREKIIRMFRDTAPASIVFDTDSLDAPTYIHWTNALGEVQKAIVLAILYSGDTLALKILLGDRTEVVSEESGDLAKNTHEWMPNIIYNLCQTLNIDPETI